MSKLSFAQLSAGDIMLVGMNFNGNDGFSFVTLVDLPANTTIFFTDKVWNGSSFNSGQNLIEWNSPGSILSSGTVITYDNTINSVSINVDVGSHQSGVMKLNKGGDMMYAFTGSLASPNFLSAFSNDNIGTSVSGTLSGTGLTVGVNAIEFTNNNDVFAYNGSTVCNTTAADCAAAIANTSNWNDNATFPSDVPAVFGGTVLPIELMYFNAKLLSDHVTLSWKTASEINNDFFLIERSIDGVNYEDIILTNGVGNSNSPITYSEIDPKPMVGVNYYRLKQVDFDGKFEIFEPVIIKNNKNINNNELVYPNPTTQYIKISGEGLIQITDMAGKDLTSIVDVEKRSSFLKLDLSNLENGVYFITTNSQRSTVIKQSTF